MYEFLFFFWFLVFWFFICLGGFFDSKLPGDEGGIFFFFSTYIYIMGWVDIYICVYTIFFERERKSKKKKDE